MAQRGFRFKDDILRAAKEAAKQRGFKSVNAFVEQAALNEIERGDSAPKESEERILATITAVSREMQK